MMRGMEFVLLADLGDWLASLFPLLIAAIYVISQLISRQKDAQPRRAPRRGAQGPGPMEPGQPRPGGANVDRPVAQGADEVQDFLRRVADLRAGEPPAQVEVAIPYPDEDEVPVTIAENLTERHLDTSKFENRGEEIVHVDDRDDQIAERLHQVFDHQVGRLSTSVTSSSGQAPPPGARQVSRSAAGFAAQLTDTRNIRQAIVINELLRRPEERW